MADRVTRPFSTDEPTREVFHHMQRPRWRRTTGLYVMSDGALSQAAYVPEGALVLGQPYIAEREHAKDLWRVDVQQPPVIVIGSDRRGPSTQGGAYVYSGGGFATETILMPSDAILGSEFSFGFAVGISQDGSTIVVSRPFGGDAVYVYNGPNWSVETKITPTAFPASDFGWSVAISADGSTIAVGDRGGDGYAYLYTDPGWATEQVFTQPNPQALEFGNAIALSGDGSVLAVGSWLDFNAGGSAGAIYVYSGVGHATETMLAPSDASAVQNDPTYGLNFGNSIGISRDGSVIIGGAPQTNDPSHSDGRGAAYIYSGVGWGTETKLTPSDAADDDAFGYAVAIAPNGGTVAVTGKYNYQAFNGTGRLYLYSGASYATEIIATRADEAASDLLGFERIAMNDQYVIAGIPYSSAQPAGASYLWLLSGGEFIQRFEASDAASGREFGVSHAISG